MVVIRRFVGGAVAALLLAEGGASAQEYLPVFHPEALKGPTVGRPNDVLVLGDAAPVGPTQGF
jgi:hypothetical protein